MTYYLGQNYSNVKPNSYHNIHEVAFNLILHIFKFLLIHLHFILHDFVVIGKGHVYTLGVFHSKICNNVLDVFCMTKYDDPFFLVPHDLCPQVVRYFSQLFHLKFIILLKVFPWFNVLNLHVLTKNK